MFEWPQLWPYVSAVAVSALIGSSPCVQKQRGACFAMELVVSLLSKTAYMCVQSLLSSVFIKIDVSVRSSRLVALVQNGP